ncbi:MAG: hypothetical protein AAGG01_14145, partial [Planctomycetota bacterium]
MITTKQKVGLGSLMTLAAAIWVPQIAQMVQGSTSAQVGVASGPGEDEMLAIEQSISRGSMDPGPMQGMPPLQPSNPEPITGSPASASTPSTGELAQDPSSDGAPAGSNA